MSVDEFFLDLDQLWPHSPSKVRLCLIGSAALMLQTDYLRGTKDSDVFETTDLSKETQELLQRHAGKGSQLHRSRKLFVDIVRNGVPFLPHVPRWHPVVDLNANLRYLELYVLDVVDVVVSKLKRFHAVDRADVHAMIQRGHVLHVHLVERFRGAVDEFVGDARAVELRQYIAHLHSVERDMFGVDETEIELPSWV